MASDNTWTGPTSLRSAYSGPVRKKKGQTVGKSVTICVAKICWPESKHLFLVWYWLHFGSQLRKRRNSEQLNKSCYQNVGITCILLQRGQLKFGADWRTERSQLLIVLNYRARGSETYAACMPSTESEMCGLCADPLMDSNPQHFSKDLQAVETKGKTINKKK